MLWRVNDLPFEISPKPFTVAYNGERGHHPVVFFPGWLVLDKNGVAVASVARGTDATFIAEFMNGRK